MSRRRVEGTPPNVAPDGRSDAPEILTGDRLVEDWRALCRWDPALPPESEPPHAEALVAAFEEALRRPQPLGWGEDAAMEPAVAAFAHASPDPEAAVAQLVCLRTAFDRMVLLLPAADEAELRRRADMIIDQAILTCVRRGVARLRDQALVDELTELGNRRALDRDLPVELSRGARHGRRVAVVAIDLDGLKQVNDTDGHDAGDRVLRGLADAARAALREQDRAYRIGGDEFLLLLPETDQPGAEAAVERMRSAGAPPFTAGFCVVDGDARPAQVVADADADLMARKRARGSTRTD